MFGIIAAPSVECNNITIAGGGGGAQGPDSAKASPE